MMGLVLWLLGGFAPARPGCPAGQIVERVVCAGEPSESYALYLPKAYRPDRPWPILYGFDARQHGPAVVALFREAAEKYGYIIAASNNARSDEGVEVNIEAMKAMWEDTHARFSVDPRRVYAAGFSGGARAACLLGLARPGEVAGVIGCSAGFPDPAAPPTSVSFAYFLTAGDEDFNYLEVRETASRLEKLGAPHRVVVFGGPHGWPPPAVCTEAIEWMDLEAMRSGVLVKSEEGLAALYQAERTRASRLEGAGRLADAFEEYSRMLSDFEGLRSLDEVRARRDLLASRPELAAERGLEARVDAEESGYVDRAQRTVVDQLRRGPDFVTAGDIAGALGISSLRKEARSDLSYQALSARRKLATLLAQTGFYLPRELAGRGDFPRAALSLLLAAEVAPDNARVRYELASVWARDGKKRKALKALRQAVERGFSDLAALEADPAFDSLRTETAYRKIAAELAARARGARSPMPGMSTRPAARRAA